MPGSYPVCGAGVPPASPPRHRIQAVLRVPCPPSPPTVRSPSDLIGDGGHARCARATGACPIRRLHGTIRSAGRPCGHRIRHPCPWTLAPPATAPPTPAPPPPTPETRTQTPPPP